MPARRYRFEKRCANLATIDLNTLLFKYEVDIATAIRDVFDDSLELEHEFELCSFPFGSEVPYTGDYQSPHSSSSSTASVQTSAEWFARAARRKELIDHYLWNEGKGLFYDYDTEKKRQSVYDTVTCFWALWAGCATDEQAAKLVKNGIHKFEVAGGLVSGTEESRGPIGLDRPNRQWE
jgi:alpha,alpha-trehalase